MPRLALAAETAAPSQDELQEEVHSEEEEYTSVFCKNMSVDMDEATLKSHFEKHGRVATVRFIMDRDTGRFYGWGFVDLFSREAAQQAVKSLNGQEILGRALTCDIARGPTGSRTPPVLNYNRANGNGRAEPQPRVQPPPRAQPPQQQRQWPQQPQQQRYFQPFPPVVPPERPRAVPTRVAHTGLNTVPTGTNTAAPKTKPAGCTSVFVGNLPPEAKKEDLINLFRHLNVKNVYFSERDGKSKGYGFVDFYDEASVDYALALNGSMLGTRSIRVDYANSNNPRQSKS